MTVRRRLVRVPASSANLGPGYDVLAAALTLHLELEVEETGTFEVDAGGLDIATDKSNLCVRAFESLRPAEGIAFRIKSEIPLAGGLGSSAAAIVAGLLAADHLYELALEPADVLARATEIEGHPDNVAAAIHGGFVVCSAGGDGEVTATRIEVPQGLEAVVVVPEGERVPTPEARKAIPESVPHLDAVANVAAASELVLGLERSDLALIARGLADRLHQPHRAHLYPLLDGGRRGGPGPGRPRGDDLGRRADRPRLELLAEHRQGRRRARGPLRRPRRASSGSPSAPWARTSRSSERDGASSDPVAVVRGLLPLDRVEQLDPLDRLGRARSRRSDRSARPPPPSRSARRRRRARCSRRRRGLRSCPRRAPSR